MEEERREKRDDEKKMMRRGEKIDREKLEKSGQTSFFPFPFFHPTKE